MSKAEEGKTPRSDLKCIERNNWKIHQLFAKKEYKQCLQMIDEVFREHGSSAIEYPLYVKALIKRQEGEVLESLQLFQAALTLHPTNHLNLRQVAKSLYLLGRHKQCLAMLEEAEKLCSDDWEIHHIRGMSYGFLKDPQQAVECFKKANSLSPHDGTFLQLGKLYMMQQSFDLAREAFLQGLEYSPENPDILTALGLLYLNSGEHYKAFDYFGKALTFDPKNLKTILAAGSIIQDHNEIDSALLRYRMAAAANPNSFQLWNNVGMCFYSKGKYISAIACLKKSLYFGPFEWIVSFNLGLVHLALKQTASAFHFFSTSVNLNPNFAPTYMYLGIALNRLEDPENACGAFEKALEMEPNHMVCLNYSIVLYNRGEKERSATLLAQFESIWDSFDAEAKNADPDIVEQYGLLKSLMASSQTTAGDQKSDE